MDLPSYKQLYKDTARQWRESILLTIVGALGSGDFPTNLPPSAKAFVDDFLENLALQHDQLRVRLSRGDAPASLPPVDVRISGADGELFSHVLPALFISMFEGPPIADVRTRGEWFPTDRARNAASSLLLVVGFAYFDSFLKETFALVHSDHPSARRRLDQSPAKERIKALPIALHGLDLDEIETAELFRHAIVHNGGRPTRKLLAKLGVETRDPLQLHPVHLPLELVLDISDKLSRIAFEAYFWAATTLLHASRDDALSDLLVPGEYLSLNDSRT